MAKKVVCVTLNCSRTAPWPLTHNTLLALWLSDNSVLLVSRSWRSMSLARVPSARRM